VFPLASLELKTIEEDAFLGRYTIEPLHPGYGVLIGNSLRRVLLSSIEGSAPIAVKIDNVPHEFSVIEGVVEDVVQIILNLKKLVVAMDTDEVRTLTLDASGERMVTAADIIPDIDVTVINPELHIAELSSPESTLRMDILVSKNRGYVPVEKNRLEDYPIGTIWMDAMFTPVKNVRFDVEQTLIEQYLDFEKLNIDILCNGAIPPRDALTQALQILSEYYTAIAQPELLKKEEAGVEQRLEERLKQPLDVAVPGIAAKTHHLLVYEGVKTLRDLLMREQDEIKQIRGISSKALKSLIESLEKSPDYELISQYTFPFFGEEEEVEEIEELVEDISEEVDDLPEDEEEEEETVEEVTVVKEEPKEEPKQTEVPKQAPVREIPEEADVPPEALNFQLEDLSLAKHTMKFLEDNGITTLVQLVTRSRFDIHGMKGFKDKIIVEIEKNLDKLGLKLATSKGFESMTQTERESAVRDMEIDVFIANDVDIPNTSVKAMDKEKIKKVGQLVDLGKAALKGSLKLSNKTIKSIEKRLQEWGIDLKE